MMRNNKFRIGVLVLIGHLFLMTFYSFAQAASVEDLLKQGDLYKEQNKNQEAFESYKKAVATDPYMARARSSLGSIYARLKNYDKAIEEMELGIKLDEKIGSQALPSLIFLYLFKNDVKAAHYLKKLIVLDPQRGSVFATQFFNARIYGIKEIEGGLSVEHYFVNSSTPRMLEVAKKADPYINSGKFDQVISIYEEFLKDKALTDPEKALVLHTIGMMYSTPLNNPQRGIIYLEKALAMDSSEIAYKIGLIDAHRSMQNYEKALNEINKMLAADPKSKYALYFQGVMYFKQQDWKKTIESWNKLKKVDEVLFALIDAEYVKAKEMSSS